MRARIAVAGLAALALAAVVFASSITETPPGDQQVQQQVHQQGPQEDSRTAGEGEAIAQESSQEDAQESRDTPVPVDAPLDLLVADPGFTSDWINALVEDISSDLEMGSAEDVLPLASDRVRRAIELHKGKGFSLFAVFAGGVGFVALQIEEHDEAARDLVAKEAARIYVLEKTKAELARGSTHQDIAYTDLNLLGLEGVWTPDGYIGVDMKPIRTNSAYRLLAKEVEDRCIRLAAGGRSTYLSSACGSHALLKKGL